MRAAPETLSLLSPGTLARPLGLVAHADWSLRADKRWVCVAAQGPDGWRLDAPVLVGDVAEPEHLLSALVEQAGGRTALVGLDAGLGLPAAWGQRAGVEAFLPFLQETVHEAGWERFWEPAASREEISLQRPFYPRRPGGTRQHHLVEGLGLDGPQALRRLCDQPRAGSPTPCPLFWTLGANQVGKATLAAWRTVVVPGLADPTLDLRVWPFSGELEPCLDGDVALAEVYPGEVAAWLGMQLAAHGGKRSQLGRKAQAAILRSALDRLGVAPTPRLQAALEDGFGGASTGEDAFDAAVGAVGLLQCCAGHRTVWQPRQAPVATLEGWVLGRAPANGDGGLG